MVRWLFNAMALCQRSLCVSVPLWFNLDSFVTIFASLRFGGCGGAMNE
jgi:hypothetical protein